MALESFEQGRKRDSNNYKLEEEWRFVQDILSIRGRQAVPMQSQVTL